MKRRDGTKWFQIDFTDQRGRRVREYAGITKTEAKNKLNQRRDEVHRNVYIHPRDKKQEDEAATTFADGAKRFLREYASERRSTYYSDTIIGRNPDKPKAILRYFGATKLRDLENDPLAFGG